MVEHWRAGYYAIYYTIAGLYFCIVRKVLHVRNQSASDKVVEADKQAFDPPLGQLLTSTPQRVVVALLDLAPLLGQEAFKEILPADERLGLGNLLDFCFRKVIVGEKAMAPPGEVLEKDSLQIRVSSGPHQISGELGHAFQPNFIGSLSLASQDMGRVFRGIASGTLVIILVLPFHECGAHATIG